MKKQFEGKHENVVLYLIKNLRLEKFFALWILVAFGCSCISCVEPVSLIQKKSLLIIILLTEYPDIKDQLIDYIVIMNNQISEDLVNINTEIKLKKYACLIRYLCLITKNNYSSEGYNCDFAELDDCHIYYITKWQDIFF